MSSVLQYEPKASLDGNKNFCDILYITECSVWGKLGLETVRAAFPSVLPIFWAHGMPKPNLEDWRGDWILSFKSDLVLSGSVLSHARKGAINFHPCPPKYRGIGGYWWAIHNGDDLFGVTCHHMNERIDHGKIIKVKTFPIWPEETEASLRHKAALYSLGLLNEAIDMIVENKPLRPCGLQWGRHLYTQKELDSARTQPDPQKNPMGLMSQHGLVPFPQGVGLKPNAAAL